MGWLFLRKVEVLTIHARAIEQFGGTEGMRDEGALSAALIAAENREHYENADLAACAATYAYHLSQAHAFVDGNKRVAAAVSEIFLRMNGGRLTASNDDVADLFIGIAAGRISRAEAEHLFHEWVESSS